MKKQLNRKGYTLAEVLIVVAIIVVLASVGVVALMAHMRNMQQLEMDGQAKEIFIAAQNHLAMANSQGYLGKSEFGMEDTVVEPGKDSIYYYVVTGNSAADDSSVLSLILPYGAVDESARSGGSYIIRYQASSGQILDVFYAATTGRYQFDFTEANYATIMALRDTAGESHKEQRKSYGATKAVLGYYGGVAASTIKKGDMLEVPTVQIINAERLQIIVTDNNDSSSNEGKNTLVLTVTGETSKAMAQWTLVGTGPFTRTLDDVTKSKEGKRHFYDTLINGNTTGANITGTFIAGENLIVKATSFCNTAYTNVAESAPQTTNSLFASLNGGVASVSNIRHLLNLDKFVSNLTTSISSVKQVSDLDWNRFESVIDEENPLSVTITSYSTGDALAAGGSYYPISPDYTLIYNGDGHSISNVSIANAASHAGVFGTLTSGSSISNLELIDCSVMSTGGNVGALVGSASGTNITAVLVHNSALGGEDNSMSISSTGAGMSAGGLVGNLNGGGIDMSAAAVYVAASGDAGGLVGTATGITISNSYAGGHTQEAKFVDLGTTGPTHVNVISTSGNAGGLIGASSGATTIEYSYSTASAASSSSGTAGVGGLIGSVGGTTTISNCYAAGLVTSDTKATNANMSIAPLVGTYTSATSAPTYSNAMFLSGLSPLAAVPSSTTGVVPVNASTKDSSFYISNETDRALAAPYDLKLSQTYGGKYCFLTIDLLHSGLSYENYENVDAEFAATFLKTHYGDWQVPSMNPLNFRLLNGDSLDLVMELDENTNEITLAVRGMSSGITRIFNLTLTHSGTDWTITAVQESAVGADNEEFKNESPVLTDFNISADSSRLSSAVSRTAKKNDGSTATVYDVTLTLDDITKQGFHFAQLFANGHVFTKGEVEQIMDLWPGENIAVYLSAGSVSWSELSEIKDKSELDSTEQAAINKYATENSLPADFNYCIHYESSLFGNNGSNADATVSISDQAANLNTMDSAQIFNVRHLQNLDYSTSLVNKVTGVAGQEFVTAATLRKDIDWTTDATYYTKIYSAEIPAGSITGTFNGIYNPKLQQLNGMYVDGDAETLDEHILSNFVIKHTTSNYTNVANTTGHAGLFRYVPDQGSDAGLTISNLYLKNTKVTGESSSAGSVGSFVGQNDGKVVLDTVLATGDHVKTDNGIVAVSNGAAGGLVGSNKGELEINNSAATLYVAASGAAGGLLGSQTDGEKVEVTIKDSYVGGHTEEGKYHVLTAAYSDPVNIGTEGGARWNIISTSGAAGGLIGSTVGSVTISQSFNTASVFGGTAGGIIGAAGGSMVFNTVYTVAPVVNVSTYGFNDDYTINTSAVTGSATSGAVFGVLSSNVSSAKLFYLADIFEGAKFDLAVENSTICALGSSSTGTAATIKLASYYAQKDEEGNYGPSAEIIGILHVESEILEKETTAFDSELGDAEYPFAIWTAFVWDKNEDKTLGIDKNESVTHFFGDWQPVENRSSDLFTFHFMIQNPVDEEEPYPIVSFSDAGKGAAPEPGNDPSKYTMALKLIPFEEAKALLPIPSMPHIEGFKPGRSIAEPSVVWTVYYGDQTAELIKSSGEIGIDSKYCVMDPDEEGQPFYFSEAGDTVQLTYDMLFDAVYPAADSGRESTREFTLVAHYYDPHDQYLLKLHDVDDLDLPETEANYKLFGSIHVIPKPTEGVANVYDYFVSSNTIEARNRQGWLFMGWYTEPNGSGDQVIRINRAGKPEWALGTNHLEFSEEESEINLWAHYEENDPVPLKLSFVQVETDASGNITKETPLNLSFAVSFDKHVGFDEEIDLPGGDTEGGVKGVKVTKTYTFSNGTMLTEEVTSDTERKFKPEGAAQHTTLSLYTGVHEGNDSDPYPSEYTIYIEGNVKTYAYVVVHELEHTLSTGTGDVYEYSNDPEHPENCVRRLDNVYKKTASQYPSFNMADIRTDIDGFTGNLKVLYSKDESSEWGDYITGTKVTVGGEELDVTCVFVVSYSRNKHKLSFNKESLGLDATRPVFMNQWFEFGQPITDYTAPISLTATPPTPVNAPNRAGFTFNGWKYKLDSGSEMDDYATKFPSMPDHDLELRATWTGAKTDFTVRIWMQNADDDGYTLMASKKFEKCANPDSKITVEPKVDTVVYKNDTENIDVTFDKETGVSLIPADAEVQSYSFGNDLEEIRYFHYSGYYVNDEENTEDDYIFSNGRTSINVLYDRNEYTLRFDIGFAQSTANSWTYTKKSKDEAMDSHEGIYGLVDGNYILLTYQPSTGNYVYTWTETKRNNYYDNRYKESTSNTAKYAYINQKFVELTPAEGFVAKDYRYQPSNNTDRTMYGIVDNRFVSLIRNGSGNGRYYTYNSTTYDGQRYLRSNADTSTPYTGERFEISGTSFVQSDVGMYGKTTSGANTYYFELEHSMTGWSYNSSSYTGTRYERGTDATFRLGWVSGIGKTELIPDGTVWYYTTTEVVTKTYTGDYYIATGAATYYVSYNTNSSGTGYTNFANGSGSNANLGNNNPFTLSDYTGTYIKQSNKRYKVFYKDITARYGSRIFEQWPTFYDKEYNGGGQTYFFVGWLANTNSWQCRESTSKTSSMKGKFERMSSKYIQNYWGNNEYVSIPADTGVPAHEFHCRYWYKQGTENTQDGAPKTYVYHHWFLDPVKAHDESAKENTGNTDYYTMMADNDYSSYIKGGQGSYPSEQSEGDFQGYDFYLKKVVNNRENGTEANPGSTYSSYSITNYPNGMIMNFYYTPKPGTLKLYTVKIKEVGAEDKVEDISSATYYYSEDLTDIINQATPSISGYTFKGWYTDEPCEKNQVIDENGDGRVVLKGELLEVYARMEHDPVEVTIDGNGGTINSGTTATIFVPWGATIASANLTLEPPVSSDGEEGGETGESGEGSETGESGETGDTGETGEDEETDRWIFDHWEWVKLDGTTTRWDANQELLMTDTDGELRLRAVWVERVGQQKAKVQVRFVYTSSAGDKDIPASALNGVTMPAFVTQGADGKWYAEKHADGDRIYTGETYVCEAPEISGYTILGSRTMTLQINQAEETLIIRYRSTNWEYNIVYYVQYENIAMPGWLEDVEFEESVLSGKVEVCTQPGPAPKNYYEMIGFTMPTEDPDDADKDLSWLSQYKFDHFEYNGNKVYKNFITIHPDADNKATVEVYLVPAPEKIFIDDIITYYDGTPQNWYDNAAYLTDHNNIAALYGPDNITGEVHYVFCKSNGDAIANDEVATELVDAGSYGVYAYVTVNVDGKDYLVWASRENASHTPPLHLYVRRRLVFLISESSVYPGDLKHGEYKDGVLTNHYVETESELSIGETSLTGYATGFAPGEGADWDFSADAFRSMKGTSSNVFNYILWDGSEPGKKLTKAKNYNFLLIFGTLTIN